MDTHIKRLFIISLGLFLIAVSPLGDFTLEELVNMSLVEMWELMTNV